MFLYSAFDQNEDIKTSSIEKITSTQQNNVEEYRLNTYEIKIGFKEKKHEELMHKNINDNQLKSNTHYDAAVIDVSLGPKYKCCIILCASILIIVFGGMISII